MGAFDHPTTRSITRNVALGLNLLTTATNVLDVLPGFQHLEQPHGYHVVDRKYVSVLLAGCNRTCSLCIEVTAQQTTNAVQGHQCLGLFHDFHRTLKLPGQAQYGFFDF